MKRNDFIRWMLHSPFHGVLSRGMMLITLTGRKTGSHYTLPVEYFQKDGFVWVITSRDRTWWRNVRNGSRVELLIKRKSVQGFAQLVLENAEIEKRLFDYLHHSPLSAKPMGIQMQKNVPSREDIARVAKDRLFVQIKLLE